MSFTFIPYNSEQSKTFANAELSYEAYVIKKKKYDKSFRYRMGWQKVKGNEYLFKECLDTKKRQSLGVKSEKTELIYNTFMMQKKALKESIKESRFMLERQEKINKFTKLNRVPIVLINLFRRINELGLDDKVIVIGTNSLYAYEAYAGLFIEEQHLATFDIDIFNKRDKKLSIAFKEKIPNKTLKGILLDIDKTFHVSEEAPYRFYNKDNVVVELITPIPTGSTKNDTFSGVLNLELEGTKWLESSKLHKQLVIGNNGKCAFITTIHPLEYAVYKKWLSTQNSREPIKRDRDLQQSRLVKALIKEYIFSIDAAEDLKDIKNMSKEAIEDFKKDDGEKVRKVIYE